MGQLRDISGGVFGRLTVLRRAKRRGTHSYWLVSCVCGQQKEVRQQLLTGGRTQSCGCLHRERVREARARGARHGHTAGGSISAEYTAWQAMKTRCYNVNQKSWADYGGRGIEVCDRWLESFENFLADVGERPSPEHSLDRIDVNGDYEPDNVRWSTYREQARNRRPSTKRPRGAFYWRGKWRE